MNAMQQEVDNYEIEIKELKKKIPKKNPFASPASNEALQRSISKNSPNTSSQNISGTNILADSSIFAQEVCKLIIIIILIIQ